MRSTARCTYITALPPSVCGALPKTQPPAISSRYINTHISFSLSVPQCWRVVCVFLLRQPTSDTHTARIVMVQLDHHNAPERKERKESVVIFPQGANGVHVVHSAGFLLISYWVSNLHYSYEHIMISY